MGNVGQRAWMGLVVLALGLVILLPACSSSSSSSQGGLRAAWDLMPLTNAILAAFPGGADVVSEGEPSTTSIERLRQGKVDAVLLGREPTPEEMVGLVDQIVAYDAVVILIDASSNKGGQFPPGSDPSHKTDGLKELALNDLKVIFNFWALEPAERWSWSGDFQSWTYVKDAEGLYIQDPNTAQYEKGWVRETKTIIPSFSFRPGKFDTQSALYQTLGVSEEEMAATLSSYTADDLVTEEEVLSSQYAAGSGDFVFKLGFASRRVLTVTPEDLPAAVVSIDGVNPVEDPQSVYDRTYPIGRKIHLLTREGGAPVLAELAEFILSHEGQQAVEQAGYLPLPQ